MRLERNHGGLPSAEPGRRESDAAIRTKAGLATCRCISRTRPGITRLCFDELRVQQSGHSLTLVYNLVDALLLVDASVRTATAPCRSQCEQVPLGMPFLKISIA